jgi:predicted DNA-binding protein
MSNTAIVSFKVAPEQYTVLKAMAASKGKSLSELVRETVEEALDLEAQMERVALLFAGATRNGAR